MGYDFIPRNKKLGSFHLGAFAWPVLIAECGMISKWFISRGPGYATPDGSYPLIISNDGFRISAKDSRFIARCARNYCAIQKALPQDWDEQKRELGPAHDLRKIREDFIEKFQLFADWAEKSSGFKIC